jgi:hypothetical protein
MTRAAGTPGGSASCSSPASGPPSGGCEDSGQIEKALRASFTEFAARVSGDVVGYEIVDPDGITIDSCGGFYGSDGFNEPNGWISQQCRGIIDADIASRREVMDILARK